MITTSVTAAGPISWQQEARLWDEHNHGDYLPVWTHFVVPGQITEDEVRRRLAAVVACQEALRIVDARLDGGGEARYAADFALPLRTCVLDSLAEMPEIVESRSRKRFPREGGPLWELILLKPKDHAPGMDWYACAAFDHLVTDGRSMTLLQKTLIATAGDVPDANWGAYREWVAWQRAEFQPGERRSNRWREFWLRYLDGSAADPATVLPFSRVKPVPGRGLLISMTVDVAVSAEELRMGASRQRATPFQLLLASVVALIARISDKNDLTLRAISNGRPRNVLDTQGWFADSVPVRVRGADIDHPSRALELVRSALLPILRSHYVTPWAYIRDTCRPDTLPAPAAVERGQVVVNFLPHVSGEVLADGEREATFPGDIDGFHLLLEPRPRGLLQLRAAFDPDLFEVSEVEVFLKKLAEQVSELAGNGCHHSNGHR